MALATPDISNDFDYLDNIEAVTVKSLQSDESFNSITPVKALREELPSGYFLGIHQITTVFHIKQLDLGGVAIKEDDRIRDSNGIEYVVMDADLQSWQTRYLCHTRRVVT